MRVSDYIATSYRELSRQKVRSALTIFALAISTAILVALGAMSLGGREAITSKLAPDSSLAAIIVTSNKTASGLSLFGSVQEANDTTAKLTDESVTQLQTINGVKSVSPRANVWEFQKFSVEGSAKAFIAQAQGTLVSSVDALSAGASFSSDTAQEVIIGSKYMTDLGYPNPSDAVGKKITITTQNGYRGDGAVIPSPRATKGQLETFNNTPTTLTATIVGVTGAGTDENKILLPMGWARNVRTAQLAPGERSDRLQEDGYAAIIVQAIDVSAVKPVTSSIDALGYGQISTQSVIDRLTQFSTIMWFILGAVALVALLAASLGIVNTMLMAVSEQRYVIGIWRACGAKRSTIAGQFLVQALLLGILGGALGATAGWYASMIINQRIASILEAQHLPVVHIATAPLWLCLVGIGLATGFAIIAGLYPAWRAARQDPSKVLRSI